MEESKNTFEYTYSAVEQEEIRRIRDKYAPPAPETAVERLRRLDESVTRPGKIAALSLGTVGILLLGVGMCCVMVWTAYFALGVAIGLVGMLAMALAYPMFNRITQKRRAKLAPEILRLTEELMK